MSMTGWALLAGGIALWIIGYTRRREARKQWKAEQARLDAENDRWFEEWNRPEARESRWIARLTRVMEKVDEHRARESNDEPR